jgi:CcmD family protein
MENALYLFSAYSIAWVIIFLYCYGISRRQKSLENQIAEMKEILREDIQS